MNASLKEKWVAALRSGKYKQIQGTMRKSKYECCVLGVLCTVAGAKWKKHMNPMYDKEKHYYLVGPDGTPTQRAVLDDNMILLAGLTPREMDNTVGLIKMNDFGYTFDEIANVIEELY